jgi:hypothetical protein
MIFQHGESKSAIAPSPSPALFTGKSDLNRHWLPKNQDRANHLRAPTSRPPIAVRRMFIPMNFNFPMISRITLFPQDPSSLLFSAE